MSDLHAAFLAQGDVTLSRLDELLAYLETKLDPDALDRVKQLLGATVSMAYSARLHDEDAPDPEEPPPEQTVVHALPAIADEPAWLPIPPGVMPHHETDDATKDGDRPAGRSA